MRVLAAGIGNIFLGDDGFGVRSSNTSPKPRLRTCNAPRTSESESCTWPTNRSTATRFRCSWTRIAGRDTPGAVPAIEAEPPTTAPDSLDAHRMTTDGVFCLAHNLAGTIGKTFIIECEPVDRSERIGLSAPVRASVDQATVLTRGRSEEIIGRTTAS